MLCASPTHRTEHCHPHIGDTAQLSSRQEGNATTEEEETHCEPHPPHCETGETGAEDTITVGARVRELIRRGES